MLTNYTILIFVMFIAVFNVYGQKTVGSDETAIRAGVEQMMKGWNAKSGAEFAKPFAEDADYVVINGTRIKSRALIEKGHQGIFDTIYKNTNLSLAVESIRFLRPDIAVVHVQGDLKFTQDDMTNSDKARITLVMIKDQNKWQIAAFQNTHIENSVKNDKNEKN